MNQHTLIDDETLAALPAPLGNQCRSFIQAAEKIRRAVGSDADRVQLEAQQVRVAQALATDEGRLIPEVEFTRNPLVSNCTVANESPPPVIRSRAAQLLRVKGYGDHHGHPSHRKTQ